MKRINMQHCGHSKDKTAPDQLKRMAIYQCGFLEKQVGGGRDRSHGLKSHLVFFFLF